MYVQCYAIFEAHRNSLVPQSILTMIPVMTSFLPAANPHLYMPTFFRLWEAFNSSIIDDRLLDTCGMLSEEFVASKSGDAGETAAEYKDVGIWSEAEWTLLIGKALNSMSKQFKAHIEELSVDRFLDVPVGAVKVSSEMVLLGQSSDKIVRVQAQLLSMQILWAIASH